MKLIIHMGFGKTGTTSIQSSLLINYEYLKKRGIWYLGIILDKAVIKYKWQQYKIPIMKEFNKLNKEDKKKELLDVLKDTITEAKKNNIHTLVWSNEELWPIKEEVLEICKELKNDIDVKLIFYVRNYDSWMFSAYKQWGIFHKTYEGKLKNFKSFKKIKKPNFYDRIKFFLDFCSENIILRNMSAINDVVEDFFSLLNIDMKKLQKLKVNESKTNEELFLRALYNSQFDKKVLPIEFNKIFGSNLNTNQSPKDFLKSYFPTEEDIKDIFEETKNEREKINKLLIAQGQKPLKEKISELKEFSFDHEKLLMALSEIVIKQSIKIQQLEEEIIKLKNNKK